MIGGFLGAGKTTAIRHYVKWLQSVKGLKTAVITNDQADGLVDSDLMEDAGIHSEEIAGGCFCCRSDLLMETADRIVNEFDPDIILAEPVGSCTDLVATVSLPISVIFKRHFNVGPLSVLVDPFRAERVIKREAIGGTDANDLDYIYLKQLEEAQVIVVNKKELLSPERATALLRNLKQRYPQSCVFLVSARNGEGLHEWWEYLQANSAKPSGVIDMDYQRYAESEARLGWVNATYRGALVAEQDYNEIGRVISEHVVRRFIDERISVAHFKLRIAPREDSGSALVMQWVDDERKPEFTSFATKGFGSFRVTVNLRAESEPKLIGEIVHEAVSLGFCGTSLVQESIAAFSPSAPNPVHRVSSVPHEKRAM